MQTHDDDSHKPNPEDFLAALEARAKKAQGLGTAQITAGAPGEKPLFESMSGGVMVRQLPEDVQGIIRISIGGGGHLPIPMKYLTYRGDKEQVEALLREALMALATLS